ncbi:MAG: hypothetical protein NVSMB62_17200 [Acidobacteriaceae bacterium]
MCGIVGYIGPKSPVPIIIEGLRRLEYRGYDSAGIAVAGGGNGLELRRAPGKLRNLEAVIADSPIHGSFGIGHTRWATHGRPTEENAHPHRDGSGTLVVVHNGIVENYLALKAELKAKGHIFASETDTEIIAHLIEDELNKAGASNPAQKKDGAHKKNVVILSDSEGPASSLSPNQKQLSRAATKKSPRSPHAGTSARTPTHAPHSESAQSPGSL